MSEEILQLIQGVLLVVAALFPIINPLGNAPFFLGLTQDQTGAERRTLARKVAFNGFVLLLGVSRFRSCSSPAACSWPVSGGNA